MLLEEHGSELFRFEILINREHPASYVTFLDHFGPALLGVKAWRLNRGFQPIDSLLTYSDETFLLMVIDGNYRRWDFEMEHPDDHSENLNKPVSLAIVLAM